MAANTLLWTHQKEKILVYQTERKSANIKNNRIRRMRNINDLENFIPRTS